LKKHGLINLFNLNWELPGNWLHYIKPDFEFVRKILAWEFYEFHIHEDGIFIQKNIPPDQKRNYPDVVYYRVSNKTLNDYKLEVLHTKVEVARLIAKNFENYLKKYQELPKNCTFLFETKFGALFFEYNPTQYDEFVIRLKPSRKK